MTPTQSPTTETWYISFGLGGAHRHQYTEVVVPLVSSDGTSLTNTERHDLVRSAVVSSYGQDWAFDYSSKPDFMERPEFSLRERIEVSA